MRDARVSGAELTKLSAKYLRMANDKVAIYLIVTAIES